MKNHFYFYTLFLIFTASLLTSCNDDEETEEPETPVNAAPNNTPTFQGAHATLVALNTKTVTETPFGNVPVELGTGVAAFFNETGDAMVDAGTVTLNESQLTKYNNNSYVFTPSATQFTGIDFTNGTDWEVSGGNGFSSFTHSPSFSFPSAGEVTSSSTVSKADGYTLTVSNMTGADSIIYIVGSVIKTRPGNAGSCTFSAAELNALSTGPNVAQAAGYTYTSEEFSGKTVYFVKEIVVTKTVTVE